MNEFRYGYERVEMYGDKLGLSDRVVGRAMDRCKEVELDSTINRSPKTIAAASIYIESLLNNEKKSIDEVCDVVGLTAYSLKKAYVDLIEFDDGLSKGGEP